jgi:hypothetical protein
MKLLIIPMLILLFRSILTSALLSFQFANHWNIIILQNQLILNIYQNSTSFLEFLFFLELLLHSENLEKNWEKEKIIWIASTLSKFLFLFRHFPTYSIMVHHNISILGSEMIKYLRFLNYLLIKITMPKKRSCYSIWPKPE